MEIKILKQENGEIIFKYDEKENKFEYESFDRLIEKVYNNDEEVVFQSENENKDYEELLKGIINGARTEDYRRAVDEAKKANEDYEIEKMLN